ncbi:DUF6777 domain-containing protein [Streptomyces xanthii]|uniref:DUF6777 domain-containing protein n=1 Tax=Streptomyces xanthii TaxID=2768069 RepID=A0A7H1B2H1_9ACTN|nr:DUF6777 domain-containing protein [Streptomyces xanthii]QNS02926.1 hypothetical protein IAG42_04320 [Streptomyces xanthii]
MRARIRTKTYVTALGISAALLLAGCSSGDGAGDQTVGVAAGAKGTLHLQPITDDGPDPFTDSTATSDATPPPVTRTPQPAPSGSATGNPEGLKSYSGSTPGLYGGTRSVGSCDVEKQVRFLTSDQAKAGAFAEASGIDRADIASFLRGLTPVVLRVDTRVTNHGYRDGSATSFQSVLQAGTAVLVDRHGLPRVRCACGNPIAAPVALKGTPRQKGKAWEGYRPTEVIVITPAPQIIQNITIINIVNNTWIQRPIGDDGHHDKPVPPPSPTPTSPSPSPSDSETSPSPSDSESDSASPSDSPSSSECPTPTATSTPVSPSPWPSGCPTPTLASDSPSPDTSSDSPAPDTVPESPDQPDGAGLIPDASSQDEASAG